MFEWENKFMNCSFEFSSNKPVKCTRWTERETSTFVIQKLA